MAGPSIGTFKRARWAAGIAVTLIIVAIARYPGGTFRDHSTAGYEFFHNFLSDLGMTVAHDGQPNRLGAAMFTTALLLLVIGIGSALFALVRLHSTTAAARPFARVAAGVGVIVCCCFAGVALTPENRVLDLHILMTKSAFRLFPLIPLLLFVASIRAAFPSGVRVAWLFLTIMLGAYVWILDFGPRVTTPDGFVVQVAAQKVIATTVIATFLFLSIQAERVMAVRSS